MPTPRELLRRHTPPPVSTAQLPGVIDERYQVRGIIGRGGAAVVLMATDMKTGKPVALKVLHPHLVDDAAVVERFDLEAGAAQRLEHRNLVSFLDSGHHQGIPYLVMELVQGPSMAEYIESRGAMPEARALELGLQASRALGVMHRHGIVHRDVKPANLLLEMQGTEPKRVKVADLGFARVPGKRITQEGKTMGTGSYMAPEQVVGESVDARTDVYALGITLYFALTAERPFSGTQGEVMCRQLLVEAPPPSAIRPGVSGAADELVATALCKHPGNRYQSMAAMRDDIERALSGRRLEGVPPVREPDAFTPESELGTQVMEVLRSQYL